MTELMDFFKRTGSQGGKKAAANMTPEARVERARKAAAAREAKRKAKARRRRQRLGRSGPRQRERRVDMLNLYRRHLETCKHTDQNYTGCNCPIWCYGTLNGRHVRRSVGTRDMSRASKCIDAWQTSSAAGGGPVQTMAQVIASYLGDCRARNLAESTRVSYAKTLEHFRAFCEKTGIRHIEEIDLGALTDFRAGRRVVVQAGDTTEERNLAPSTSGKELETLRAFCAFAKKHHWIAENFARELKSPKEDGCPTMPFKPAEVDAILQACDRLEDDNPHTRERSRARARALCLVMLYSGLRISDAVKLRRETVDLSTGKMLLRVMKTGKPLYVRLGEPAIDALGALPAGGEYFFWTGESRLATAVGNARKSISRVLAVAKMKGTRIASVTRFPWGCSKRGKTSARFSYSWGTPASRRPRSTTRPSWSPSSGSFDAATAKLDFGARVHTRTKSGLSGISESSDRSTRSKRISKLQILKAG